MRSYSFFTIVFLCIAILVVDVFAFYWVQSITAFFNSGLLKKLINITFWVFSIGLIASILILKYRLDHISRQRKFLLITSLYGVAISSFIPKLVFVTVISILYFTNRVVTGNESAILILLVGLVSGFFPFFIILYAIFRSLYRFKLHTISLHFPHLPQNFDGLRIIHISDAHLGSFNYRYHIFDRAIKMINDANPDLILFTGDLVNNFASELDGWKETFQQLKAAKGKFAVLGNHDYGDYSKWNSAADKKDNFEAIKDFYGSIGFQLLLNEAAIIENENANIAILGVENWGHPPFMQYGNLNKAMQQIQQTPFKILLSHDPSHWPQEVTKQTNIALTLSGHTHGMQAGIKIMSKSWSPIKYKYKHWAGLYKQNDQYLYVNRGLGWLGFPGRLGMRPEITLIELFQSKSNGKN
ncbi:MAG: metallophosphoesterase [Chitinophagaceae bacterium]